MKTNREGSPRDRTRVDYCNGEEMPHRVVGGFDPSSRRCCAVRCNFACLFGFNSTHILAIEQRTRPTSCHLPPSKHKWLRSFQIDHKVTAHTQFKTVFLLLLIHHLPMDSKSEPTSTQTSIEMEFHISEATQQSKKKLLTVSSSPQK